MLFKNPIFLSFLLSVVVFMTLFFYYNRTNKTMKKNEKKKYKLNENMFIASIVSGVVMWALSSYYIDNTESKILDINKPMRQKGGISHQINTDSNLSMDIIETGINIPKNDFKLPNVLIDYN